MLTEGDRIQLAPYLAEIHATRAARPEAEREADRARQYLVDFRRGTTLWDRWFNRDSPTGLAYREAKKARRDVVASIARGGKQIETLYRALDREIGPMMPRLDSKYEARVHAIESCTQTGRVCDRNRGPIETFVRTVREAAQNGRDEKARKDAETARLRYPRDLLQARKAAAAVKQAVDRMGDAVAGSGVRPPRLRWDAAVFTRLPRTAEGISALQLLVREQPKVQGVLSDVDRLRAQLTELRKRTAEAQRAARIRARDRLIEESAPAP